MRTAPARRTKPEGHGRFWPRLAMMAADALVLALALWAGYALRFGEWWPTPELYAHWWLFPILPAVGVAVFLWLGLYREFVRYMELRTLWVVGKGVALLALLIWAAAHFYPHYAGLPRSVPANFVLTALIFVAGWRLLVRAHGRWALRHYTDKQPVAIYGAGSAGIQLATALTNSREYYPAVFFDDAPTLAGSSIHGIRVHSPARAPHLLRRQKIQRVLLALPNASKLERKRALDSLRDCPVQVRTMPSVSALVAGDGALEALREVELEDLLGRDPPPLAGELADAAIAGKVVLITAAGGALGAELARQVIARRPARLLLLDACASALRALDEELRATAAESGQAASCVRLLGRATDAARLRRLCEAFRVHTVYHTAACREADLAEENVLAALEDHVVGAWRAARAARAAGVESFVLVSTEAAARASNVLGAAARSSERLLQSLAAERIGQTCFVAVRCADDLGAPAALLARLRRQIAAGGPVQVPHPDATRYLLSVAETAALVLQAAALGNGGELFVLDKGEPVKLLDLARRMIHLSGCRVREPADPTGQIAIDFSGLEPGEPLHEQCLPAGNLTGTAYPRILASQPEPLAPSAAQALIERLQVALSDADPVAALAALQPALPAPLEAPQKDLVWRRLHNAEPAKVVVLASPPSARP